ncbi:MAG: ABC transporter ATP-binding protein [Alphaproteobacteria bacterium]|nr:ABC transporter ATP-binding protein [Alphaproteobacteria bacterium]
MSDSYLRLRNIVKSYDGISNAVDDINIDIAKGEFITFLGPSGSGKTTTLMMIAGFEDPTRGTIDLDGKDLTVQKPYQRNIGMVFQNYALFPHMTVAKNVAFPLRMRGAPRADIGRRVAEALELVGLSRFSERHPRELSGGQQQRVALARGLVFRPDVLLLDEPLGALDKNLREQMQVELKRIHREVGITMVYVTHDQTEAMTMSDRVAVFNQGRLEQVAPPLEVYGRPLTRFVGEFIGDSNFLQGRIEAGANGKLAIDGIGPVCAASELGAGAPAGPVHVLIRPERLRLIGKEPRPDLVATVQMRVEGTVNYGDSLLVMGQSGQIPLRVRIAGMESGDVREGRTISVGWCADDMHLIPGS